MENKRGWIQIVEAFVAILLVAGIILLVLGQRDTRVESNSGIHDFEIAILREIQLNDTLSQSVLATAPLPAKWNDEQFPVDVKDRISGKVPSEIGCEAMICDLDVECSLTGTRSGDIFVEQTTISASLETYSPRALKLFCWDK